MTRYRVIHISKTYVHTNSSSFSLKTLDVAIELLYLINRFVHPVHFRRPHAAIVTRVARSLISQVHQRRRRLQNFEWRSQLPPFEDEPLDGWWQSRGSSRNRETKIDT
jgi:hypothetical protein